MNLSKPVAVSATMRSRRFASSPLVRGFTLAGVMLALGSVNLPQASAVTAAVHDHFTFTVSQGDRLPEEVMIDLDGNTLDSANSQSGLVKVISQSTGLVVSKSTATHGANLSTAEVKTLARTEIIGVGVDNALLAGDISLWSLSAAGMADAFTISTTNAALLPGATATITFTIDGNFNLPTGVDYDSGSLFAPLNGAYAQGELALFNPGAIDFYAQAQLLDPADPNYNATYAALFNAYNNERFFYTSQMLHSHQDTVDAINDPQFRLATNGPGQMILTAEVALNNLDTTFEWLAQLTVRTDLDGATGYASIEADFASTGVLTVAVPKGFTVTSGSGMFPQSSVTVFAAAATATPEPMTAVFGAMSLVGLMLATRRRCVA